MGRRVRVFLNKKSGGADAKASKLIALFAGHGCECAVTELERSLDLEALARNDPEEVAYIAAGGDGTVNCVANLVVKSGRCMGVLPVGTLNHFAKDLGLPQELEAAVAVAAGGTTRRVDAGEVNGRVFVNNSSVGMYPVLVLERERMKRTGRNHWVSLAVASVQAFVRLRRLRISVEIEGAVRRYRSPFLFVGNNEYCLEGSQLGKRERLDGGELAFFVAHDITRWGALRMAFAALAGRLRDLPEYEETKAVEAVVSVRKRRLRVSLDGEVRHMTGPLRYKMLPGALRVLGPAAEEV